MFCMNCGNEVLSGARFCPGCGTATASEGSQASAGASAHETTSAPPPPKSKRRRRFWKLHTRDWAGTCPSCGLTHTAQTTACPNDGSPLVVAFNDWLVNPTAFPIHTAHLCCLNNCGIRTNVVACNRCSTSIGHENLRFRMPLWRYLVHNAIHLGYLVFAAGVVVFLVYLVPQDAPPRNNAGRAAPALGTPEYVLAAVCVAMSLTVIAGIFHYCGGGYVFRRWWPFRYTFNFEQVERAAHKWRKYQAKGEEE